MDEKVLPLLKARLGISSGIRDPLLNAIINGIVSDCQNTHGIMLEESKADQVLFILDWATWKYQHPEDGTTPRSIQLRLKNLIIKKEAKVDGKSNVG